MLLSYFKSQAQEAESLYDENRRTISCLPNYVDLSFFYFILVDTDYMFLYNANEVIACLKIRN